MPMVDCRLFGRNVRIDFFPPTIVPASGPPELTIKASPTDLRVATSAWAFQLGHPDGLSDCTVEQSAGRLAIDIQGIATFACSSNEILYKLRAGRSLDELAWHLFGFVMAVYLEFTGTPVLHGAAVARARAAMVLLGPSGMGKSSLTLALIRAGARVLGDDHAVVSVHSGTPTLLPALPWVKVGAEVARVFDIPDAELWSLHPRSSKRGRSLSDVEVCDRSEQLAVVCSLRRVRYGELRVVRQSPVDALRTLLAQSYAPRTVQSLGYGSSRLRTLTTIVRQVPVFDVEYPDGLCDLGGVARELLSLTAVQVENFAGYARR